MAEECGVGARSRLVAAAIEQWRKDLIDVGKRNTLLYYRDLRAGTLDLGDARHEPLTALLAGRAVPMSALYPDETRRLEVQKRLRTIHKKIQELHEERGINAGYLTSGMATWHEPETQRGAAKPAAPVILRQIAIKPRSATEDDFELTLSDEVEINPVLLHRLSDEFGIDLDGQDLVELIQPSAPLDTEPVFERLCKQASEVAGFAIENRMVIGTFTYAKLPMVNDLQKGVNLLEAHDVVAALAGDRAAQQAIRGDGGSAINESLPDYTPPQDEFLVADADSSQNYAVNAVVAGKNLVIKGPPGTGKSQTITNLVATLIARGYRVLFVAEKRAAIDAVLSRLQRVDLGGLVMDLHDGSPNRRKVAQDLAATLDRASQTPPTNLADQHRDLATNRERVLAHTRCLHQRRTPWDISVFDLQARLLGLPRQNIDFRFRGADLQRATETFIAAARDEIVEYAELGGLTLSESPWTGAPITTPEQVRTALDCVTQLRGHTLPLAVNALAVLSGETGLAEPQTVSNWPDVLRLLDGVADILKSFAPEVFEQDLSPLIAATASRGWRKQHAITLGWSERRRLRKQARIHWHAGTPATADLHTKLVAAQMVNAQWGDTCRDGRGPRLPADLPAVHGAYEQLTSNLAALTSHINQTVDLETLSMAKLSRLVDDLIADQATLHRLPRRHHLETRLHGAGLVSFLDECRRLHINAYHVAEVLEKAWLQSILDEVSFTDPAYGAFQGSTMTRTVTAFQQADTRHIRTTSARVQRTCSETLFRVLDAYPDQTTLLRAEAGKKTRHRSMRDLLAGAPDVLMALKPCWAMSPLVVSQVLPLQQLFDVVIFDEASQIPPADAIPAIVRGKRIAVAGDERQLPPTNFFGAAPTDDDQPETDSATVALTTGYESILDALTAIVPFRSLAWHYRSQDERLIAFSNTHIYNRSLTTFPGSHTDGILQHVQVPSSADPGASEESAVAEVDAVVALVLQHARDRPAESLGVITMGLKHADRIEAALRAKLTGRPELNEFFLESRDERFFVKNLERVQGDERDAIILSIGYGKSADGRMVYRFGPLNNDGGERRLNVAVSRAKRRMTLVSSFGSADLDPNRLHARGAQLLREYLVFMESGGRNLGSSTPVPPPLNPFEIDIRDRLTRAGIPLTAQYGVGGYRIDFAAHHPEQPGRMVLAIEADGASYHSSYTARDRDRLRQEHLERLGWRFHRIWSTDWFRDPDTEVAKALTAYQTAVTGSDSDQGPRHTPKRTTPEAEATPGPFTSTSRTGIKPAIYPGAPITDYTQSDLTALIKWIESDGLLRTEDALIRAAMDELGYRRKGGRITVALENAIRAARDG